MPEQTTLGGAIQFLDRLGMYDVVLPFLLVFTIIFALLEKTKVLGVEKIGDYTSTKKNLNAIVAFVVAFLVIASTQLVGAINQIMAQVVLIALLLVSFMMLVGVMFGDKEFTLEAYPQWIWWLMVLIFIAIVFIFLNAFSVLDYVLGFFLIAYTQGWAAAVLFIVFIIIMIYYITSSGKPSDHKSDHKSGKSGK